MFRVLATAGLVLASSGAAVLAQDLRGPREMPPAGFQGQQYVDSRGCVFLRGGVGGTVTWVPRVSSNRRQLCGMTPSFTPEPVAVAEAPPAPAPRPRAAGAPMDTVASTTTPPRIREAAPRSRVPAASYAAPAPAAFPAAASPVPAPAPAPRVTAAPAAQVQVAVASVTPGCPAHAPYGARLQTTDGRTALLCVRSPADLPNFAQRMGVSQGRIPAPAPQVVARAAPGITAPTVTAPVSTEPVAPATAVGPRYLADGRIACPAYAPVARAFPLRGGGSTILCTTTEGGMETAVAGRSPGGQAAAPLLPAVPRGYRLAWEDDRLNPRRAQGTAAGQAAQDAVWTRETPARLVADVPPERRREVAPRRVAVSASNAPQSVTMSSSAAPKAPAAAAKGRYYVQVGSFGVPANAEGARARLAGLGLPAATGRGSIKGKPVQVVHAGPFASADQAQAALAAARRAGFADAFIR